MPRDLIRADIPKGAVLYKSANNILCVKWHDKKVVQLLSSLHSNPDMVQTNKFRYTRVRGEVIKSNVVKPKLAIDYNNGMNGVDRHEQVLASFPVVRRYAKSYKKIFF